MQHDDASMTEMDVENEQQAQLQHAIEDVHLDELRHPDPSGQRLLRLMNAIDAHVREETASIETYARVGRETNDPVVARIIELLLADEQRHHTLFRGIAASLRDRLDWVVDSSPPAHDPAMVNTLRALEREERRGAQQLRDLARLE